MGITYVIDCFIQLISAEQLVDWFSCFCDCHRFICDVTVAQLLPMEYFWFKNMQQYMFILCMEIT